jgi:hypothetical protein
VCGDGNYWEYKAYAELNDYGIATPNTPFTLTSDTSQSYQVSFLISAQGELFGTSITTTLVWTRTNGTVEMVEAPGNDDYYFANIMQQSNSENYNPLASSSPEIYSGWAGSSPRPTGWSCSDFPNALSNVC